MTSAQSTFFGGVLHCFLEDFVLQRLLAEHALKLGDFCAGRRQLGCRHDCFTSGDSGQSTLALELAPLEQQPSGDAFLASDQRHAHAWFVCAAHQRCLLSD